MPRTTEELLKDADDLLELYPAATGGMIIFLVAEMAVKLREREREKERLEDDMAFIKRWIQRVHDKETTLEECYGVLRYYNPLKPTPPKKES